MAPNAVVCRHPQATAATGSVSGTRLGVATTSSTSLAAAAEDDVDDEEEDDEEVSACAVFCAVTGYPS
jgi:poly(3-hydroxybutyrate) depolymerase